MIKEESYFYMFQNYLGRTCYGITDNPTKRLKDYIGHTGDPNIRFKLLLSGPKSDICDLETDFKNFLDEQDLAVRSINGHQLEWVQERIMYDYLKKAILRWLEEDFYNISIIAEHSTLLST